MITNKKKGTFILVNFATGLGHLSETQLLFPKGKVPIGDNYWNSFNGIFLSKKSKNPSLAKLQKSVGECVKNKKYDFKVARISNEGKVIFE